MDHTIYRKSDGCILQSGWGRPVPPDGFDWIAGQYDGATHYVDTDGQPQPFPEKPASIGSIWDREGGQWVDTRDPVAELAAARQSTSLTRMKFCERCMEFGILDPAGAAAASRGDIPPQFQSYVDDLTEMEKAYLAIRWPGANQIDRMDSFIVKIGQNAGLTEEFLDVLFMVDSEG